MKPLPPRVSVSPGPRKQITLDIAETGLADLMEGIHPERCWIEDNGDGTYVFRATQTYGESRKQVGKPAADLLVELVNELGEALNAHDVPERLRDKWDELVDRYVAGTGPA